MQNKLGNYIRNERKKKNWSIANLSIETNIPEKTISDLETGYVANPSFTNIYKVIRALDIELQDVCNIYDTECYVDMIVNELEKMDINERFKVLSFCKTMNGNTN